MTAEPQQAGQVKAPETHAPVRQHTVLDSFRYAMDGIVHVIHTQRQVRYYFTMIAVAMLLSILLRVTKLELIMLWLTIAMVLIAELINTSIEVVVDMITDAYHPLARVAKDVAGGAVLVATVVAVLVGGLIFLDKPALRSYLTHTQVTPPPNLLMVTFAALVIVLILTMLGKVKGRKGTLLKGGAVSGHAALAGFLATAAYYTTQGSPLVLLFVCSLAFLVIQSRVDAGIHSVREVVLGSGLAVFIGVLLFRLVP